MENTYAMICKLIFLNLFKINQIDTHKKIINEIIIQNLVKIYKCL